MEITTNHQIQTKTKTNRHQLYNVWLDVTSAQPGSKTVSAQVPGQEYGGSWRIPRSLVTKVRPKGSTDSGTAPTKPAVAVGMPSGVTVISPDLEARIARLEATLEKLLLQNA